jgi:O-antigen/teichoic acid export membrane protein
LNKFHNNDKDSEKKTEDKKDVVEQGEVANRFSSFGIILFLNQLVVAVGNWIFWMVISRFASTEAIGQSTTIVSLVLFCTTILQLGLEYPILKYTQKYRNSILATTMLLEVIISIASIPLVIYFIDAFYGQELKRFEWMAAIMVMTTAPWFITHFLLLGLFKIRAVLFIDIISTIFKFGIGYLLVVVGHGSLGIIIAFLGNLIVLSVLSFMLAYSELPLKLDFKLIKLFIREGLVNMPSKISRILIFSLSVIMLASFGVDDSLIGVFYIALNMSLVVGAFAINVALMVIPASTQTLKDYSSLGLRIGLSFTVPIIVLLINGPELVLGLIGHNYTIANFELIVLSLSIFPSSITITAISAFNTKSQFKKLLIIGIVEILSFALSFSILVPSFDILGASYATLIAFSASSILSILWMDRSLFKYIVNSAMALVIGVLLGYFCNYFIFKSGISELFSLFISVIISMFVIFYLNKIHINEIKQIMSAVFKKNGKV